MASSVALRWFSALLFCLVLPAASQGQPVLSATNGAEASSAAFAAAANIPQVETAPKPLQQITPEQLGDIHLVRQRYQAAIESYAKIDHPSATVWNKMGIAYQMLHDTADALRCYKASLHIDATDPRVLNNLATVQDQMSDYSAGERNYRKALKLDPNSALMYKNLGTNLLMQHEYEKGAQAYQQALALDPTIFNEHFGPKISDPAPKKERGTAAYFKARSCARAGLTDCAITHLRQAMDEGFTIQQINKESDFAPLRNTTAFANLIALEQ